MSTLEHRYRRLLRLYPRAHRHEHEEEMLAVLLACATPGQQRLTMADRLDLVRGALKIRWRHLQSVFGPGWSDALAVVSLIAPLLMLACSPSAMVWPITDADFDPRGLPGMPFDPKEILRVSYVVGWTVVVVTGAAGKRGIAAATAAVLAAMALCFRIMNLVEGVWPAQDMTDSPLVLTGLIAATALIASPGPRRGAQLIGIRCTLLAFAASALIFVLNSELVTGDKFYDEPHFLGLLPYLLLVPVVTAQPTLRLRAAALLVPHVAGTAAYRVGAQYGDGTRRFVADISGLHTLFEEEAASVMAYAVAVLSLLLLLLLLRVLSLRARAARVPTRNTSAPQDRSLSMQG